MDAAILTPRPDLETAERELARHETFEWAAWVLYRVTGADPMLHRQAMVASQARARVETALRNLRREAVSA